MAALLAGDNENPSMRGKIDLIYIDPPFDSKADYRTKVKLPGTEIDQRPTVIEQFAYSDTWADGTASYVATMIPRIVLAKELLSHTGSLFLHLDYHVGHYLKVVLDDIFGRNHLESQIIWNYRVFSQAAVAGNQFEHTHDTIYHYAKVPGEHYFKQIPVEQKISLQEAKQRGYSKDQRGYFKTAPTGLGKGGYSQQTIDEMDSQGLIYWTRSGLPRKKYYVPHNETHLIDSKIIGGVWSDIPDMMHSSKSENVGYATQKPEKLLDRIIESSCPSAGLVADFFCGSGTTAAVAEKLGRRWIATDLGKPAAMITRKRLIDQGAVPFYYQAIGDYQMEQAKSTFGRSYRISDLAKIVLNIYGAIPLPAEHNPNGNLGRIAVGHTNTLVVAESPNRLTTLTALKRSQGLRDSLMGGFDKVILLGWNFSAGIAEDVRALNDPNLEVLVIPPDLLDRLKKKGGKAKDLAGKLRFSSLQYLQTTPATRSIEGEEESLTVSLENYVFLSPEAINLDEENRKKLQSVMNDDPLALIEYWAVDPDYDGKVFRSVWQDYRGNTESDGDALRVVKHATLRLPIKDRKRTVCVRAVDVFGFESEVVLKDVEVSK